MKSSKLALITATVLIASTILPATSSVTYAATQPSSYSLGSTLTGIVKSIESKITNIAKEKEQQEKERLEKERLEKERLEKDKQEKESKAAADKIVQDTVNKLTPLKNNAQSTLTGIAFKYTLTKNSKERASLTQQGRSTLSSTEASYNVIMQDSEAKLKAIGADSSALNPVAQAFQDFLSEGKSILKKIIG